MSDRNVYLKPNVVFEPLVNKWYAWSHLISPATAAMNLMGRHIPIMTSYIENPELHAEAVRNAKMKGGPFIDLDGKKTAEIEKLKNDTLKQQKRLVQLAAAINSLEDLLAREATGEGLESLYPKVPALLRGLVELYYDRNNQPGYRFFESLLFKSEFYDPSNQRMAFWLTNNDERPFCLSTPKIEQEGVLQLPIPFHHAGIDVMAAMKRVPQSFNYIKEMLDIPPEQEELFRSFFTEQVPPVYRKYEGDKIRMRYFGHACILIETRELSILVDPLISYYGYHSDVEHFSDADLPDSIDYVLVTHNHQDHVLLETLLLLRHKVKQFIVPRTYGGRLEDPSLKLMMNAIGFNNVIEIDEMQEIRFEDAVITGIPFTGEHSDLNILTKSCYLVQIGQFKLLFLADSRVQEPALYERVARHTGDVDVMFLGMECEGAPLSWLYGPLMVKKLTRSQDLSRRLSGSDCEKGMSLVNIFNPAEVYVYAMGQEPWLEFITSIKLTEESHPIVQSNKLIALCGEKGIIAERLFGEKELLYNKDSMLVI
ncbi:MBL fold metallo-hydrolase [Chitinophaga varians]|uniref:MBL fold metallo-hydrolase n=1 Tax=Chitinophaga varians TaxID=2202339 RepID=UPI00165FB755|nr:MBL fold metallo-hydrolase [Chitinophaga varians]MBC9914692.1 MBL fold metallo-hydrolase [Chitinophaga varians]